MSPRAGTAWAREVKVRRGQAAYRANLLQLWMGCSVTGCTHAAALVASHIKPWKVATPRERRDIFNGLLLVASLDALFDKGYIGFTASGTMRVSPLVDRRDWNALGLARQMRLRRVHADNRQYLEWHLRHVFVDK